MLLTRTAEAHALENSSGPRLPHVIFCSKSDLRVVAELVGLEGRGRTVGHIPDEVRRRFTIARGVI